MYILKLIALVAMTLLGYLFIPIFLAFTPKGSKKLSCPWADSIWGNVRDGIYGDKSYNDNQVKTFWFASMFPRYHWIAVRNPVNKLIYKLGVSGHVKTFTDDGKIKKLVTHEGKKFWMIDRYLEYPFLSKKYNRGWHIQIGYRLFEDHAKGHEKYLTEGFYYTNTIVFNIFRLWKSLPK